MQCSHHLQKKRGRDKIKSTGNGKRFLRQSMAKLLLVNGREQSCRGSDSNVELNDTRGSETSSVRGLAKRCF
jgi:hypothetical protein